MMVDTTPMSPERINEMRQLRNAIMGVPIPTLRQVIASLRQFQDNEQLKYDFFRFKGSDTERYRDPVIELLTWWHNEHDDVIEALSLLEVASVNIYDQSLNLNGTAHALFSLIGLTDHHFNTRSIAFMCSKMSTLNLVSGNYSLLSRALYLRAYPAIRVMINHGLDMSFRDGFGFNGYDYLNHAHNPDRNPRRDEAEGRLVIPVNFLREWQALIIARNNQSPSARPRIRGL